MSNLVEVNGRLLDLPIDIADYWRGRLHHDIYRLTSALASAYFYKAQSAIDVGCFTSGLICEFDWIQRRVASDIKDTLAQNWKHVPGVSFVAGNAFEIDFEDKFDMVLSNQTVEHLDRPREFVEKLIDLGRGLIISTTYETAAGLIPGHTQDPISLEKFQSWFPCKLDGWAVCYHPTNRAIGHIIGVVRDSHPNRKN
jgi:SAM-dependent methyltransferase